VQASQKSDLERTELQREKSGVFTGGFAKNPLTDENIPIWIADYVLNSYGTGNTLPLNPLTLLTQKDRAEEQQSVCSVLLCPGSTRSNREIFLR